MSAKPYSEAEIAERRANPLCVYVLGQEPYPETMEQRWLATVDALKARLAAAEAEAERARGALVEVRRMIESDAYRASITARIDAHLDAHPAPKPEQGGEVRS